MHLNTPVSPVRVVNGSMAHFEECAQFSGTVLLVDDEDLLRRVLKRMLVRMGLTVLEARDGLSALQVLAETSEEISLILLDWNMPRMNGSETLERLQQLCIDIPVLVLSGDESTRAERNSSLVRGTLKKPFPARGLAHYLRGVLPQTPH